MRSVIDSLFLRRPRLEYVSPAICEFPFSSSSFPSIILNDIARLSAPGDIVWGIGGDFPGNPVIFNWGNTPGVICRSVYIQVDPGNPDSPFNLVSECVPPGTIGLCTPGSYQISVTTDEGESELSSPIVGTGEDYLFIPLPQTPGILCYNLYRDSVKIWTCFSGGAFEICQPGCYSISNITLDGESPLSETFCVDCIPTACPTGFTWSEGMCMCLPDEICIPDAEDILCSPGMHFDLVACQCVNNPTGGAGSGSGVTGTGLSADDPFRIPACGNVDFFWSYTPPTGTAPFTYLVTSGSLPAGIVASTESNQRTLDLSGIPTAPGVQVFSMSVTDFLGASYSLFFRFDILGISNLNSIPHFHPGKAYTPFQLTGAGGTGPYTFDMRTSEALGESFPNGAFISMAGSVEVGGSGVLGETVPLGDYLFRILFKDSTNRLCTIHTKVVVDEETGFIDDLGQTFWLRQKGNIFGGVPIANGRPVYYLDRVLSSELQSDSSGGPGAATTGDGTGVVAWYNAITNHVWWYNTDGAVYHDIMDVGAGGRMADVNGLGQVLLDQIDGGSLHHAWIFTPSGSVLTEVSQVGGVDETVPERLNDAGMVAALITNTGEAPFRRVKRYSSGVWTNLYAETSPGAASIVGFNSSGHVLIQATESGSGVLYLEAGAGLVEIARHASGVAGFGVTDDGFVAYTKGSPELPFIWSAAGGHVAIPLPPGATSATLQAINQSGVVAGYTITPFSKGFVFDRASGTTSVLEDLLPADSGWSNLSFVYTISDDNIVIGQGQHGVDTHSFALKVIL